MQRHVVHQGVSEQVRQMAYRGKYRVMLGRLHAAQLRTAGKPGGAYTLERRRRRFGQGRDHHFASLVQVCASRGGTAIFGTRDRVGGDKLPDLRPEAGAGQRNNILLGAAPVADDAAGRKLGGNRTQHRFGLRHGNRHQHQVCPDHSGSRVIGEYVDNTQGLGRLQIGGRTSHTDDPPDNAGFFQRQCERPAYQADADYHQGVDAKRSRCHAATAHEKARAGAKKGPHAGDDTSWKRPTGAGFQSIAPPGKDLFTRVTATPVSPLRPWRVPPKNVHFPAAGRW